MTFDSLSLHPTILKAIADEGYTQPTPIQEKAIPIVLEGKDLLGCAQTGTGKTAAFAMPILHLLQPLGLKPNERRHIRTLVLTPTRELAIQIAESFSAYGRHTGLTNTVIFGGVNQFHQTEALKRGVDILIATPGRLLDLAQQGFVHLKHLEIFVLDEADRMLDMGFINDVRKVINLLTKKRQTLFFSATMPPDIVHLANSILNNPEKVEVTPPSTTAETINQSVLFVEKGNKNDLLLFMLKKKKMETVLVFTRTKHGADKVVKVLLKNRIRAAAIHGNKSQNARQNALNDFKEKKIQVLVATDIAARGIDVDKLSYVINYEIPHVSETYVHRIGRSGRAGADGTAFTFCDPEEISLLRDIEKLIGMPVPVMVEHPYPYNPEDFVKVAAVAAKSKSSIGIHPNEKKKKRRPNNKNRRPKPPGKGA